MIHPGEIYWIDFPVGGRRPVVVLSRDELNRGTWILVATCTTSRFDVRSRMPGNVALRAGQFGMARDCVVQCENILSVDRAHLTVSDRIGRLDDLAMRDVVRAVGYVIASDCEPV